jgi:L-threonylcarbamoyladenylate synthase
MPGKPSATILTADTPQAAAEAVQRAASALRSGQVVALPTETVYGLAANALDPAAVARIFEVKGRPSHNPIIVHIASLEMARQCVAHWPVLAGKLAHSFWPGPLTMVLPRAKQIPDIVTAGGETVGVRWPSHPLMQAVIQACGFPLAAPSANLSNQLSPTNAAHVASQLGGRIPLIVDGGQCQVGLESTVLDLSVSPPRLLRPGMIHAEALLAVTGKLATGAAGDHVLKSPGMLRKHYSPRARLVVWNWADEQELTRQLARCGLPLDLCHVVSHTRIPSGTGIGRVAVVPHDPEAFARALYAELHECDRLGARLIVVEAPPAAGEWQAITDRLSRAAAA